MMRGWGRRGRPQHNTQHARTQHPAAHTHIYGGATAYGARVSYALRPATRRPLSPLQNAGTAHEQQRQQQQARRERVCRGVAVCGLASRGQGTRKNTRENCNNTTRIHRTKGGATYTKRCARICASHYSKAKEEKEPVETAPHTCIHIS
jgi:hypothetical protein